MMDKWRLFAIATRILLVAVLLGLLASPAWGQQPERVKVLIAFRHQPGPAEQALVRGMGGSVKYTYHLVPAIAATLPEPAISALAANPHVARVEPDLQMRAMETELENSWGVTRIGAGTVHDSGNKGKGIRLVIIDSGINYNHPDLNDNYVDGYDFVQGDDEPMDVYGHGTHVAGTACAEDNDNGVDDSTGKFGVVGVAPQCDLYALRVLDDAGFGYASDLIEALEWAVHPDHPMQVANLSLGWDMNPGDTVRDAFDNAEAAGLVIVAAACNNGNRPGKGDNVCYPALYDSVIAVAATDASDRRASFSSTGAQVELAAPGVSVFSTWNDGTGYLDPQPVCSGEDESDCYKYGSGTSMASPHAAGTAALILAANPGWTNDQVRAQLRATADDLGDTGWDPHYGFGLVDAAEAAAVPANEPPVVSITNPADGASFDSGAMILFNGTAGDPEEGDLADSLVWVSSIDDKLGTGSSISADLSDGKHTITASATDIGEQTGSASISITVGSLPSKPTMASVSGFTYAITGGRDGKKHLSVTVALVDDLGDPVAGAYVSILLEQDLGSSWTFTGTTGSEGTVAFSLSNAPSGCYTTTVTDVTAGGLTWDDGDPGNASDKFCK